MWATLCRCVRSAAASLRICSILTPISSRCIIRCRSMKLQQIIFIDAEARHGIDPAHNPKPPYIHRRIIAVEPAEAAVHQLAEPIRPVTLVPFVSAADGAEQISADAGESPD